MIGVVTLNRNILVNGQVYPVSKYQKDKKLIVGEEVEVKLENEYPESCDVFCEGDETCMICFYGNEVAIIK